MPMQMQIETAEECFTDFIRDNADDKNSCGDGVQF